MALSPSAFMANLFFYFLSLVTPTRQHLPLQIPSYDLFIFFSFMKQTGGNFWVNYTHEHFGEALPNRLYSGMTQSKNIQSTKTVTL